MVVASPPPPTFGAIRWDCWNGRARDVISDTVAITMQPQEYRWRLPWYAGADPRNASLVVFDADRQAVMDQELRLAHDAGLGFFAYDTYCVWPDDESR